MAKTAADILIETLVDTWNVRHVFALPGDGINGIFEALRTRQDKIRLIQVRHEEAAAFAACAYSKFTGGLGVCLATSGPGAIHLLNGLYDAKMDGASVLAITGQTYHDLIGTWYQQEVDLLSLFEDVAEYNHEVRAPGGVEAMANEAVKAALAHHTVSHISFPTDLQHEPAPKAWIRAGLGHHESMGHSNGAWVPAAPVPPDDALDRAAEVLNKGERIAMLVGAGALQATREIQTIAERLDAPIVHALLGKAVVPADHPNHMGGIGLLGDRPGQLALEQCTTLLIVGSSMPYLNYYPPVGQARAVQIDLNAERIGLRYPVEVGLPGDATATLNALMPRLDPSGKGQDWLSMLRDEKDNWLKVLRQKAERDDVPMKPQRVAWELNKHVPQNAILCGDSGTNTTWYSRYLDVRPGMKASNSGNLATMACGLPYAIGAQVAYPDRRAVAFVGDGAFTMLMGEMLTAVKYGLPIVVVMLRNDYLGQIRWEQMAFVGNPEFGVELHNPMSFANWAEDCGGQGIKVTEPGELADAFSRAFAKTDGPTLVECVIDPNEAPLPPKTSTEHALNFARATARGQPNPVRLGLTMFRDKIDEALVQGVGRIPGPKHARHNRKRRRDRENV